MRFDFDFKYTYKGVASELAGRKQERREKKKETEKAGRGEERRRGRTKALTVKRKKQCRSASIPSFPLSYLIHSLSLSRACSIKHKQSQDRKQNNLYPKASSMSVEEEMVTKSPSTSLYPREKARFTPSFDLRKVTRLGYESETQRRG